jgi:hypothetical protein
MQHDKRNVNRVGTEGRLQGASGYLAAAPGAHPFSRHTPLARKRGDRLTYDLFILYADRKLLTPETIARIATQFHLPAERTEIQSDWHYLSTETPNGLVPLHKDYDSFVGCALMLAGSG